MCRTLSAFVAILLGLALLPSLAGAESQDGYSKELGLPYWAPGRGEVDHDALRRRALVVLDRQFSAFVAASETLAQATEAHCDHDAPQDEVTEALKDTWLAWAPLDSYQFGPIEMTGAALSVNFWPDKKNFVGRALRDLLAQTDQAQRDPAVVAAGSAAAQGLPAIELLITTGAPACPAIIGISGALRETAADLYAGWFDTNGWADLARAAGPDNPVYLSAGEFTKTLYTALDFGLIRIAEQRLGRPLGTYRRSYPTRAEAWRSGLTAEIIDAQLAGIAEMVRDGFAGDVREPDRKWMLRVIGQARDRIDRIGMPIPEAVEDPHSRVRVEALQSKVRHLRDVLAEDIGPGLGVDTGFSPADGD